MNWTNHKRINTVFVVGIIFLFVGLLVNEFILAKFFTADGNIENRFYLILIRIFDIANIIIGLTLVIFKDRIKLKNLCKNAALVFLSLLLVSIMLEVILRFLRPGYEYAAKGKFVADQFRIWENPKNETYYRKHPDLKEDHLVIHNSLGFRQHREFPVKKPKDTVRIGFFGDSYTENLRMQAQYSFTEPLDYLLNKAGKKFEVMNFGTDAYGTDQEYLQYIQEGTKVGLDVVFYVYCRNDLRDIRVNDLIDISQQRGLIIKNRRNGNVLIGFFKKLYLTYLFIDFFSRYGLDLEHEINIIANKELTQRHNERVKDPRYEAIQVDFVKGNTNKDVGKTLEIFLAILSEMKKVCTQNGSKFYIVTLPSEDEAKMYDILREKGFETLNLFPEFNRIYQNREYRFKNDYHWNEEGNKLAAVSLFRFLAGKFSINNLGNQFIEQSLYEYYSSFKPSRVTTVFLRKHDDFPVSLNNKINSKYLALER